MLRLAMPVLAEELLTILVGYTDWWLAGHFLQTTDHKAAMGLMSYVMWLLPSLFAAVAIGATALIARSVGAKDHRQASHVANQALLIGGVLAVLATAVVLLGGRYLIDFMQLEPRAAELAWRYLLIVAPGLPLIMVEQVSAACLRGAGDTVSGFVAKSIVNVVNVILSTLLIIGPGPIPQLGWEGIAVGTVCGHVVGGLILLGLLLRGRAGLQLRRKWLRPNLDLLKRLLRIGVPGGIDVMAVLSCHLIYVSIINSLGTLAAAAHGLGVQIEALAYLPGAAFQVAATTLSGQYLGAKEPKRASRSVLMTLAVGCTLMSLAALVFYFGGQLLATFFTGDSQDTAGLLTARLLKIVAFATPFLGVLQILTGALRGAGDTRWPLVITFVGLVGVRIPGAVLLAWEPFQFANVVIPCLGWGVLGAWWAMVVDTMLRSLLVTLRFWQGGWKRTRV